MRTPPARVSPTSSACVAVQGDANPRLARRSWILALLGAWLFPIAGVATTAADIRAEKASSTSRVLGRVEASRPARQSQTPQAQGGRPSIWTPANDAALSAATRRPLSPRRYRAFAVDRTDLVGTLAAAPAERRLPAPQTAVTLDLPWPDGGTRRFLVYESSIMAPELAAEFPELKTYRGIGVDDPTASVSLDMTPSGFHAMVVSPSGTVFVDPYSTDDPSLYVAYNKRDYDRTQAPFREGRQTASRRRWQPPSSHRTAARFEPTGLPSRPPGNTPPPMAVPLPAR